MSTYKITVQLTNEIPNQPPFGFSLLFDDLADLGCSIPRFTGPAAERLIITNFCIQSNTELVDYDASFPIGPFSMVPPKPRITIDILITDMVTGKSLQLNQICDQVTIEESSPDCIEDHTYPLLEYFDRTDDEVTANGNG